MALRSWTIRGLILAVLAALAVAGWVASSWVSPERVKAQVLATLDEQFDGVDVQLGSARMRLLGGIAVTDLRLTRRGDPSGEPFLVVPSGVLYHDKEQLNRGRLVIRKVELDGPRVRVERRADGTWNVSGVLKPTTPDKPVPTFVARAATVTVVDGSPGGLPPLELTDARFTLLNDPLTVLTAQAHASSAAVGPVQVRARVNRVSGQVSLAVELPDLPLGPAAAAVAERLAPKAAPYLARLTAKTGVKADVSFTPDASPAWRHDVTVTLADGRFEHPDLPWAVEKLRATARSIDGRVKVESAAARFGPVTVELSAESRSPDGAGGGPGAGEPPSLDDPVAILAMVEDRLQKAEVTVRGVPLDDALFDRLPDAAREARRTFDAAGKVDVGYKFARDTSAGWKRELEVRPRDGRVVYEKFRYPLTDLHGSVKRACTHAGPGDTVIDLVGTAAGQPVTIQGRVGGGDGPGRVVNVRLAASNLPLDESIIGALPGRFPHVVRQFRATGRADVVAELRRGQGIGENEFRIDIRDATVNYTQFPYPLRNVKGRLHIKVSPDGPDGRPLGRDEIAFDGFTGEHAGGTVWLHGSKRIVPGNPDKVLELHMGGNGCPIDPDLQAAMSALKLDSVWRTFAPTGALTFSADLEVIDREAPGSPVGPRALPPSVMQVVAGRTPADPPFDPATDLKATFSFSGPTVVPSFFPYELSDLSGWLEYKAGRVDLARFAGRHGTSRVKLAAGDVRFYPDGAVWANLGKLDITPVVPDAAFLKALPAKLRSAAEELKLRGRADLTVNHLVVLTPPDKPPVAKQLPPPTPLASGAGTDRRVGQVFAPPHRNGNGNGPVPAWLDAPRGAAPPLGSPLNGVARSQAPDSFPPPTPTPTPPATDDPDAVVYWDLELALAGAAAEIGVSWDEMFGRVGCRGRYEGTHLGLVRGNAYLDRAVVAKQPVTAAKIGFAAAPQQPDPAQPGQFCPSEVEFADITGTLFHGTVGGAARVVLADPPRYDLWLKAAEVRLDEVARHYQLGSDADLKGVAQAELKLFNRQDPRTGRWAVEGAGTVDVPSGRMYNLPVLLDLVKVLKLQAPDKTAFEEAHAEFRLQGDRLKVDHLDLIGAAVCLGGSGEVGTDGQHVKFEFYVIWSQLLKRWLTTPVGDLTAFFSKNLFQIKMTRRDGKLVYEGEVVPRVTEPVKGVIERMKTRTGRLLGK